MELKHKSFPTENQFKSRLLDKELLLGGWASMGSTVATEILGLSGLDWVLIDGEHGANDHSSCVHQRPATISLMRPAGTPISFASRYLEVAHQTRPCFDSTGFFLGCSVLSVWGR